MTNISRLHLLIYQGLLKRSRVFPRLWADHVIKRDDQTGLAFGGGTVTFKLTLRPRAQCHLRNRRSHDQTTPLENGYVVMQGALA